MVYFEICKADHGGIFCQVSILVLMDGVLRDRPDDGRAIRHHPVSILVLMDGVLRVLRARSLYQPETQVSILVLMDGVLRVFISPQQTHKLTHVSILVLMDGVLRGFSPHRMRGCDGSFNPCSNGWCTSSDFTAAAAVRALMFQSLF